MGQKRNLRRMAVVACRNRPRAIVIVIIGWPVRFARIASGNLILMMRIICEKSAPNLRLLRRLANAEGGAILAVISLRAEIGMIKR